MRNYDNIDIKTEDCLVFPTNDQNYPTEQNFPTNEQNFQTIDQNFPTINQNYPTNDENFPTDDQNFPTISQNLPNQVLDLETDHKLVILSKQEQKDEVLSRKNSANYLNSVYKCEHCFKGFMTEATYKNHMARHDLVSQIVLTRVFTAL